MSKNLRQSIDKIHKKPERSDISWVNVDTIFGTFGAEITEGRGSRFRVALNDVRAVFIVPTRRE